MIINNQNKDIAIEYALNLLLSGKLVAVPTETVYGLAADMTNQIAVNTIYSIKNRPLNHPLIVHIANKEDLDIYCNHVPSYVLELINKVWPGPITFILKKTSKVPPYVTGNQDSVAIRMPSHELTLELINKLGKPIVAPSANKFMGISPTRPEHVIDEFNGMIDVLDGGECVNGLESTIIDATQEESYKILRPGFITTESIDLILGKHHNQIKFSDNYNHSLKFPGNCFKHYSPKKELLIFSNQSQFEVLMNKFASLYVIHHSDQQKYKKFCNYKMICTPDEYARHFYHALRVGDGSSCEALAIEAPPNNSEMWSAIWDRLSKASSQYFPK